MMGQAEWDAVFYMLDGLAVESQSVPTLIPRIKKLGGIQGSDSHPQLALSHVLRCFSKQGLKLRRFSQE